MLDNDLTTAKETKSSPEPTQRRKSSAELFASFIIYLISGIIVMVVMFLVYIYG